MTKLLVTANSKIPINEALFTVNILIHFDFVCIIERIMPNNYYLKIMQLAFDPDRSVFENDTKTVRF